MSAPLEPPRWDVCALAHRAAHDLRAPLARIHAFADLVRADAEALDDDDARALEIVSRSAREAGALVGSLLALTLAAHRPLERGPVDVRASLEAVSAELRDELERAGATLSLGALGTVEADAELLGALCRELVANALGFGEEGRGPEIVVEMDYTDSGDPIRLRFVDDGPGIAPERRARLLEPFESDAPQGRTRPGLGLALCRAVCDRHGWDLELRCDGVGTEVRVTFGR